jgi:PAS domain S-box-containing protein
MADEARKTGIGIIGDVPWGTHFCHFYRAKEDLLNVLVPYFKTGLENNEFCLWATSEPLGAEEAHKAMEKAMPSFARYADSGQIEIVPHDQWYLQDGLFDSERVIRAWVDELDRALAAGYSGMRASGNISWLERKDWESFADYEDALNRVIGKYKMLALCAYWLENISAADIFEVAGSHTFAVVGRNGDLELVEGALYRKKAEEALRESEKKYRQLIETINEGIWVVDKDSNVTFVNPPMAEMMGYTVEEMMGKNLFSLVMNERGAEFGERKLESRRQGMKERYEVEAIRKDGTPIYVSVCASPILDDEGQYAGSIAGVQDITERKRAEEKERNAQQELGVSSRLASLGRLASGVAHEINNPLSTVIGYSQLLMEKDVPEDIQDELQAINDSAQRVAGVVNGLLAFGHQNRVGREYVDINTIVSDVLKIRAYEMSVSNIEVETRLARDLPETSVYAGQIQQVFLNIVLNAEQAMTKAHNGGHFLVVTKRVGDSIRITFKDDGIGIAKENLRSIFDPFFTTKGVGEGTGLGLSISYGIIREHNGRIYAEGEPGKGATFVVELPIVAKPDQPEAPEKPAKEPGRKVTGRILVVDDEPTLCQMLAQLLTREGHSVETVDNCSAALEKITHERFSLILLDIKMKGTNGIDLYEQIAKIAPAMQRRVVFITGDTLSARTNRFLEKARAPYIAKPFDIQELRERVNQMLMEGRTPE